MQGSFPMSCFPRVQRWVGKQALMKRVILSEIPSQQPLVSTSTSFTVSAHFQFYQVRLVCAEHTQCCWDCYIGWRVWYLGILFCSLLGYGKSTFCFVRLRCSRTEKTELCKQLDGKMYYFKVILNLYLLFIHCEEYVWAVTLKSSRSFVWML